MHPRTGATLEELRGVDWFSCVGMRDTDGVEFVSSWAEAIESCSSLEWENLCLEASNQYRERLLERSPDRFRQWNSIVGELKPITQLLVRQKAVNVIDQNQLPKVFLDTVDWDILGLCMEAEYADVYPPGFYASQAYWYLHGHFPCGWRGNFPKGNIIIY
jgi:hypothetical protein